MAQRNQELRVPVRSQGEDGHAPGQWVLGAAKRGSLGGDTMEVLPRPLHPVGGHPAQPQGPLYQRTLGKGNCSQNTFFFPLRFFFFSFPKVLKFWKNSAFLAAKGGSLCGKGSFHGPRSTIRQGRKPSWWQDRRGRDAPLAPTGLLMSGDREGGGPSVCVPHREGTRVTWQLPVLPALVG